jgi:hypothetical protein
MKKWILPMLIFIQLSTIVVAQNINKVATKSDDNNLVKGEFVKRIDYKLPTFRPTTFSEKRARIRHLSTSDKSEYYLQISQEYSYEQGFSSISLEEVNELLQVVLILEKEVVRDMLLYPESLDNTYSSVEGFAIGYSIENEKVEWFIEHGTDSLAYFTFKDPSKIIELFQSAIIKVEEIKQLNK